MKILKYILGIIAVLAIVFILLGFIKPNLQYDCETVVEKPIEESWAFAQDPERMSEWLSGFKRMEHVSGTPGTVGAVSMVYFDSNGQEMSIKEKITDIDHESISMTYESDFMDMDYKMTMVPEDGKTKISSTTLASGNGMFSKSLMVIIGGSVKGQEEANLALLKKAIEENTKVYSD